MIQPDIGAAIKDALGKNYSKKILDYLEEKAIRKPSGMAYTRNEIYKSVNGLREYEELEVAIIDAVEKHKQDLALEMQRREKLLK